MLCFWRWGWRFWPIAAPTKGCFSARRCASGLRYGCWGREVHGWGTVALRLVLPAALVLAVAAAGTCYYYWRVTGNPFRMPYQVARDQYATARIYLWEQPLPVPAYRHQQMRDFYAGWELTKFLEAKSLGGLAWNTLGKVGAFWMFFLGPALTLPLLFGWRLFRDRRVRPLVVIGGISRGADWRSIPGFTRTTRPR